MYIVSTCIKRNCIACVVGMDCVTHLKDMMGSKGQGVGMEDADSDKVFLHMVVNQDKPLQKHKM